MKIYIFYIKKRLGSYQLELPWKKNDKQSKFCYFYPRIIQEFWHQKCLGHHQDFPNIIKSIILSFLLIFVFSLFKKFSLTVLWWFLFLRKQSKNQIKGLKLRIFKSLKRHNRLALTGWGLAPTRIITKPNMNNCILVQLLQNCAKFNCPEQDIENYGSSLIVTCVVYDTDI